MPIWLSEVGVVSLLWGVSLFLSHATFDRPLDAHHEFLMAHSLLSLRNLDQWGFGQLLGASILIPRSLEYLQADVTTFTKADGIYLSYPTLWLAVPYGIFKLFSLAISNANLQIYHLVVNRWLDGVILYFLLREIIDLLVNAEFGTKGRRLWAFLGTAGWMCNPPVLYWTQNVYFCDQGVLLPIYGLTLFALRHRFRFADLSTSKQVLFFALSVLAAGFDWYGWVFLFVLMVIVGFPLRSRGWTELWRSLRWMLVAIAMMGGWFLAQLFYFKDGIPQITNTALQRTGASSGADIGATFHTIFLHWTYYLPPSLTTLFWQSDVWFTLIVIVILLLLCGFALGLLYRHSGDRACLRSLYGLLFVPPLLQIILLRQHSAIHDFSTFKLAFPTAFVMWVALPLAFLHLFPSLRRLVLGVGVVMAVAAIANSPRQLVDFAEVGLPYAQELGAVVQKYIASHDLPISDQVRAHPPQAPWYTNRTIYTTPQLPTLAKKLNLENMDAFQPVVLAYADLTPSSKVKVLCRDRWQPIPETLLARHLLLCRSQNLRQLFLS
jgi:hypothetical protein